MYSIIIKKKARKFLDKLPQSEQRRITNALQLLPHSGDIKQVKGYDNFMRLRVGDYRIIYTVDNNILTIYVLDAGKRGDIYKRY